MAGISRVNGDVVVTSTLYSELQLDIFKINPSANLTDSTGGSGSAITKGKIEAIADELNPLMFEADGTADMVVVMDGHANDINSIAARVGPVMTGNAGTVAAGVFTDGTSGDTVTVTAPGTLLGL